MEKIIYKTCAFVGHRDIIETEELVNRLTNLIEDLIVNHNVGVFLFGSMSDFNSLCYKIVTNLRKKYPHIKREYIRATGDYDENAWCNIYNLNFYERTYFPDEIRNAGRLRYVERNNVMIDRSDYCVFYYDENYAPPRRKESKKSLTTYQPNSGTRMAYEYATRKKKNIYNVFK